MSKPRNVSDYGLLLLLGSGCSEAPTDPQGSTYTGAPTEMVGDEDTNVTAPAAPASPTSPTTPAATHVVDPSRPCDDEGHGDATTPFCKFQAGVDALSAGDILEVRGGTYTARVQVRVSGTKEARITILAAQGETVVLDAGCPSFPCHEEDLSPTDTYDGMHIADQDYITVQDITIVNAPINGIAARNTTSLVLDGVTARKSGQSGINIYDSVELVVRRSTLSRANLGIVEV
ncbi:MAG: right-handed parallel beta-helix repeat-containing protein [Nannocystaceae bacterium]